jgi:hypothetical protein
MNLEILQRSRRPLKIGDIFVLRPRGRSYYWGRVVSTTAFGPMGAGRTVVIYIYDVQSQSLNLVPDLPLNRLLLGPICTNRLPWSRGYFQTVTNQPLRPENVLSPNSLHDILKNQIVDEGGRVVHKPCKPIGNFLLESFRTIDEIVSDKLGIPQAPDD